MCMRFFHGKDGPNKDVVLMQYKYKESDLYWMPYNYEGIPVFSDTALALGEGMFAAPPLCPPKPWPEAEKIRKYLLEQAGLNEQEKQEGRLFFDSVPTKSSDIPDQKKFNWRLPELAAKFQAARASPPAAPGERVGVSTRPEKPDERIIFLALPLLTTGVRTSNELQTLLGRNTLWNSAKGPNSWLDNLSLTRQALTPALTLTQAPAPARAPLILPLILLTMTRQRTPANQLLGLDERVLPIPKPTAGTT